MEPEFWHERWQQQKIGFHLDAVNPLLTRYWSRLRVPAPATVFVPLCGKSHDLIWLRHQGYQVKGVELSPLAVADFFAEQQLPAQRQQVDGFEVWETDDLQIWCGDFFQLTPAHLGHIDACYDRAALIAMPDSMRPEYVHHVMTLTRQAPQLLITLSYPQSQMAGPPFSVPSDEVLALYSAYYPALAAPIFSEDVLAASPQFVERGLSGLTESVFVMQVPNK